MYTSQNYMFDFELQRYIFYLEQQNHYLFFLKKTSRKEPSAHFNGNFCKYNCHETVTIKPITEPTNTSNAKCCDKYIRE